MIRCFAWMLVTGLAAASLWLAGVATASPGLDIDQVEVCLACHADLADMMDAAVPHAPVAAGECTACHNPHVSRFAALLRDRPGPVCLECHDNVRGEIGRDVAHEPAADGRCVDCHDPHGGSHGALLLAGGSDLCARCHTEIASWQEKPVQHVPFEVGDCSTCHEPHGADHAGLSSGGGSTACVSCHDVDQGFRRSHDGYPVETADCQQCHDPHASARAGLFRETLHPPFEEGPRTTCHALPGSSDPFRTRVGMDQLCGECHEEQVTAAQHAPVPHISGAGGNCTSCHNAHTADGSGLLLASLTSVCLSCHDPGGASSGEETRHTNHGEGLDCTTCHQPHGGDRPLLLTDSSTLLCGTCHSHQHSTAHPQGEEFRDPRNGVQLQCLSCHGIHDAPYPKYMHLAGERDLCIACHKEPGR